MHSDEDGKEKVDLANLDTDRCFPTYCELDDWRVVVRSVVGSSTTCHNRLFAIWRLYAPNNGSSGGHCVSAIAKKPQD